MATETVDRRSGHHRSVVVTTMASLFGLVAAGICEFVLGVGPTDNTALFVLLGTIVVQFPILQVMGFDLDDFSAKDYIFVAFMTFSLWFVSWTLMLTAAA